MYSHALMNNSSILFLDEPTTGLDVQSMIKIRDLIGELSKQGLTIFLTTHNMQEANIMCERIAIINKGKLVAIDTPEKLKSRAKKNAVIVSFNKPNGKTLNRLERIEEALKVIKEGDKYKIYTSKPSEIIHQICQYCERENMKMESLSLTSLLGQHGLRNPIKALIQQLHYLIECTDENF